MLENATNAAIEYDNGIFERILYNSRQNEAEPLSPWMHHMLKSVVCKPLYFYHGHEQDITDYVVSSVIDYVDATGITNFVVGVSGGADSATVLAVLKAAQAKNSDIKIHAYTLPINQKPKEVDLAKEVCEFLGIKLNYKDLTYAASVMVDDIGLDSENSSDYNIRRGNVYARLRMTYLYDAAKSVNGIVVSTDNFSEYSAGLFTVNGDVGDFAPLQSFFKSTEIPVIAQELGLPEKFWRVVPTDGLGISNSDEDQLGMTYLEWDILTISYLSLVGITNKYMEAKTGIEHIKFDHEMVEEVILLGVSDEMEASEQDKEKLKIFLDRIYSTWFKRYGTIRVTDGVVNKLELLHYTEIATTVPDSPMF